MATQKRVNADSLIIHAFEPFLLVNPFYKPFVNVLSIEPIS